MQAGELYSAVVSHVPSTDSENWMVRVGRQADPHHILTGTYQVKLSRSLRLT